MPSYEAYDRTDITKEPWRWNTAGPMRAPIQRGSYFAAARGPTGLTAGLAELHAIRQSLTSPSRGQLLNQQQNVLIPTTGAAQYWYVDPRATQRGDMIDLLNRKGVSPVGIDRELRGVGLLPPNTPTMLKQNILGNAPRLADEDRKRLLEDIDTSIYGAPAPTPTPTPQTPRLYPMSFLT